MLLAAPALAQPSPGHSEDALRQMRNEQQLVASHGQPARHGAATEADRRTAGPSDPIAWVIQAQAATRRNRASEATELLERAETRLLTRVVPPAGDAEQPMHSPAVERLGAARAALHSHDRAAALREMDLALAAMRAMPGDDMGTGTGTRTVPMQGGGTMMQMPGSGTMMPPDGGLSSAPLASPLASPPGSPGMGSMGSAPAPLLRGPPE
jgi:hypothetical protein